MNPLLVRRSVSLASALLFFGTSLAQSADSVPAGFTALYNGTDLTGWRGGDTFDHRKLLALPEDQRKAKVAEWTKTMREHWRAEGAELVNDGNGAYATTEQDYGDFELLVEYRTVAGADSGIYLRGVPQVQIWDSNDASKFPLGADKGSGGLWNNSPGAEGKDPLVKADKPLGEWNKFRIVMVGARVSVWLNDQHVVKHALLENYYDRKTPIPARGPIQLQTHGGEIRWRNIFIREISGQEANQILAAVSDYAGFQALWNGKDFDGWGGPVENYEIVEGAIRCRPGKGGTIYAKQELADFVARLEFALPPGGNNGLAIRYPGEGDPAYSGMTELQVLDNDAPQYAKLDPRQYHGSAYGMAAAERGYLRATGEWNIQEVTVKGSTIQVELNGTRILQCDLAAIDPSTIMAGSPHPGMKRPSGYFGFAGHNDPVSFRSVRVKKL